MQVQLESTTKTVKLVINGQEVPARIWEGVTASGIKVHAFITRIAIAKGEDDQQFVNELQECLPPSYEIAITYAGDGRLVL